MYTFIVRLAPGGQRLFKNGLGSFYLADDSGHDPELTDDGPLRVEESLGVTIYPANCSVTVWRERSGRQAHVTISHAEALALLDHVPLRTGWGGGIEALYELLKR